MSFTGKIDEGLYQRTARGGAWVFAISVVSQGLSFVRVMILARVLAPKDFGLFGVATLAMATLSILSTTGFTTALIQKKGKIESYLNVAWTIEILRSLIIFISLFFVAPYVAAFFNAPAAIPIIRVIGISILLQSFANVGVIYFRKELEFNKQFFYQLSGLLADFVVAVLAVLILKSVWALVFGLLASNMVELVVSYFIHSYRPRFALELGKIKELFSFGKWVLGSSIVAFLFLQGGHIFVGKFLGVVSLGFYQMAYRIPNLSVTEVTRVISQVCFPAYSKLQDNLYELRQACLKTLQFSAFLSTPLAVGIFILAPEFTRIFLTEKWMPMVPALQILTLFCLLMPVGITAITMFYAIGKPQIVTRWTTIRLVILAIAIYPLTAQWGITGTSIAIVLSQLVFVIGMSYIIVKVMQCGWKSFSDPMFLPFIGAAIMALLLFGLKAVFGIIGIEQFVLLVFVSAIAYFGVTYLLDRFFNYGMYSLIEESFNAFRGNRNKKV